MPEHAVFVERDRECVGLIIRNVATLRYEDRASVRLADAYRWARAFQPADDRPVVVLIDPPYQEYERRAKVLNQMIAQLVEKMPAGSVVVLEAGRVLDERILAGFRVLGHPPLQQHADRDQGDRRCRWLTQAPAWMSPPAASRTDRDGGESEDDLDE